MIYITHSTLNKGCMTCNVNQLTKNVAASPKVDDINGTSV